MSGRVLLVPMGLVFFVSAGLVLLYWRWYRRRRQDIAAERSRAMSDGCPRDPADAQSVTSKVRSKRSTKCILLSLLTSHLYLSRMPVPVFTHPSCLKHDPGPRASGNLRPTRAVLERLSSEPGVDAPRGRAGRARAAAGRASRALSRNGGGNEPAGRRRAVSGHRAEPRQLGCGSGWCWSVRLPLPIMRGEGKGHAFAAIRPPGHHALAGKGMGFCLVNNVVVAARHAQAAGRERVLIIDWDVHHGNGTQALVESDATVRYVSLHQYPWYPGTGAADERGVGNVFNVPRGPGKPASLYVEDLWAAIVAATTGLDSGRRAHIRRVRCHEGRSARRLYPGARALHRLDHAAPGSAALHADRRAHGGWICASAPGRRGSFPRASHSRWAPQATFFYHVLSRTLASTAADGCRAASAPHQAPLHHRPWWSERLSDSLGQARRCGWQRRVG